MQAASSSFRSSLKLIFCLCPKVASVLIALASNHFSRPALLESPRIIQLVKALWDSSWVLFMPCAYCQTQQAVALVPKMLTFRTGRQAVVKTSTGALAGRCGAGPRARECRLTHALQNVPPLCCRSCSLPALWIPSSTPGSCRSRAWYCLHLAFAQALPWNVIWTYQPEDGERASDSFLITLSIRDEHHVPVLQHFKKISDCWSALLWSALGLVACRAGSRWPWFLGGNITSLQSQIHCPSYSKVREITQTLSIMSLAAIFR